MLSCDELDSTMEASTSSSSYAPTTVTIASNADGGEGTSLGLGEDKEVSSADRILAHERFRCVPQWPHTYAHTDTERVK